MNKDSFYLPTHEWVRLEEDNVAFIGLTSFAVEQLGDIVYMEFPQNEKELKKGDVFGVVESVKSASDMYMPIGGTVIESNHAIIDNFDNLKKDAYLDGWLVKIKASDISELKYLMNVEEYEKFLKNESH